jgi:hypothetical protein
MFAPGYLPPLMSREIALAKVQGPGIMLQIMGGLLMLSALATPLLLLIPDAEDENVILAIVAVCLPLGLAAGGLTFFCGSQFKALQSYYLVLATIVVMLIVGLLVCPLLALPGIWPMIVMLDSGVKANFDAKPTKF